MYFDLKSYLKCYWVALVKQRFLFRRWVIMFGLFLLFGFVWTFNTVGRGLDRLLFWGYRKQAVKSPIFIVANPRSGTTFLHRLMCLDEERFTNFQLWETIFPSVVIQKVIRGIARVDRVVGRPLGRIAGWIERFAFGGWKDIHPMGFTQAEEDEGIFLYTWNSPTVYVFFPWIKQLPEFGFTDRLPAKKRDKVMNYYRRSLQRQLYLGKSDKTLLSKNVLFCGRVKSILATFPDAKFIYLIRDPKKAVPSFVSMFHKVWHWHSPDIAEDSPESRALGQMAIDYYRHVWDAKDQIPNEQMITVSYDQLVDEPAKTVESVYQQFGLEMSPEFRARLQSDTERQRSYKSRHEYSLERYGMNERDVLAQLKDVIAAYGLNHSA